MAYCVNCGVELDKSLRACPLCNTPVVNPADLAAPKSAVDPFPAKRAVIERAKRSDVAILVSVILLATMAASGLLNLLLYRTGAWSLAIIGGCVVGWVICVPVLIYTRLPIYVSILLDGLSVALYLYLISITAAQGVDWLLKLGFPILTLAVVLAEVMTLLIRHVNHSFLGVSTYVITSIALMCGGIEGVIDLYFHGHASLGWSAVVITVCAVIDAALITILSRRRLRGEVRRRLHF